jgi:hypothetical protein
MITFLAGKQIKWDSSDAQELRLFLEGSVGIRMIDHLLSLTPGAYDGPNGNQIISAAKKIEGYQEALKNLVDLIKEQPPQPTENETYPDLDDESKWAAPAKTN